jgi:hypothetical protein
MWQCFKGRDHLISRLQDFKERQGRGLQSLKHAHPDKEWPSEGGLAAQVGTQPQASHSHTHTRPPRPEADICDGVAGVAKNDMERQRKESQAAAKPMAVANRGCDQAEQGERKSDSGPVGRESGAAESGAR